MCSDYVNSDWNYINNLLYSIVDELKDKELAQEFCEANKLNHLSGINKMEKVAISFLRKVASTYYYPDDFIEAFDIHLEDHKVCFKNLCEQSFLSIKESKILIKYIEYVYHNELLDRNHEFLKFGISLINKLMDGRNII